MLKHLFILSLWFIFFPSIAHPNCVDCYLKTADKRYETFSYVLKEMKKRGVKTIIETGTARNGISNCVGDGCSTVIFADWARANNAFVYSVDIDEQALLNAKNALGSNQQYVHFVCSDSVTFLKHFGQTIDFLYLDSYDFEVNNPYPSQRHHLEEIQAAYPFLTKKSIVMIDDCDLPYGGKGALAIRYLLQRDWVIVKKGYQVILVKKK